MSPLNGKNATSTKRDAAVFHKHFNPPEDGDQQKRIHAKKGKLKGSTKENTPTGERNNKRIK
eukprot:11917984-Ditylum_brightwellii.AAC.1